VRIFLLLSMMPRSSGQGDEEHIFFYWASKLRSTVFFGLCLKTDSCGLVIWILKSPRRFLVLSLKTKLTMIYRLRHKTDGRRMVRDTRRNLAACFAVKQAGLEFLSLPQNWWRSDNKWCTWHHRIDSVKMKSKIDGLMRRAASDSSILILPFSYY
jgi:hypothetical protein